ncbi:tyrosinase family protein [Burkholderia gladioli]|uniref:tyrosinase family protein n=1 Tax=Burkholderia gladioli TaxID=28095 RepID=UPI001640CA0F|nr:tyrosinase family protein [Burkholderia gladioli]
MSNTTRRDFLMTAGAAVGASMLMLNGKRVFAEEAANAAAARYRRYNVTSADGQRMLRSYARGIAAMLALPATHPQNWFRNAFIHMMDCPHGNWWFYVWHRGYIGYFEQTIRNLSGDASFALPYWDWTQLPEIPAAMFDGVLTPTDAAYVPYTGNLARFTSFIQPALQDYWNNRLTGFQRAQQRARGYAVFNQLWDDVTGFSASMNAGISGNMAYAITCGARYLSRDNPKLDPKTAYDVSPGVIRSGLQPTLFYSPDIGNSFTSSRTSSHVIQPDGTTQFSILEGLPHNKVHNYIGGVGPVSPGPFGNMTNFLSPVDPIFFLHHANMDRLWDVWTRKQLAYGRPTLPTGADWNSFASDPFLFYVNGAGQYVSGSAGDYVNMSKFDYDYQPGFGLDAGEQRERAARKALGLKGVLSASGASVAVPTELIRSYLGDEQQPAPIASITLRRPEGDSIDREFDVLVNAPADVTRVEADSPYYAGTVAFFGPTMHGMKMAHDATFALPLPRALGAFANPSGAAASARLDVRVVPSGAAGGKPLPLRGLSVQTQEQ